MSESRDQETFYVVWSPQGGPPTVSYPKFEMARKAAYKLRYKLPQQDFIVLKSCWGIRGKSVAEDETPSIDHVDPTEPLEVSPPAEPILIIAEHNASEPTPSAIPANRVETSSPDLLSVNPPSDVPVNQATLETSSRPIRLTGRRRSVQPIANPPAAIASDRLPSKRPTRKPSTS